MKNFKNVFLMLFIVLLILLASHSCIKVYDVHNQLLETQNELEETQLMMSEQSKQFSEQIATQVSNQKELEEKFVELQKQYEIMNEELKQLKIRTSAKGIVEESSQINRWGITLTEDEIELLARIVMLEAGGESDKGKDAVVEVIFNRMIDEDFPDTLEGVLSESGQFTTWKNRNIQRATPTDAVYESIYYVLSGQTDIFPFETVYFSRSPQNDKIQEVIGGHVFCNK